MASALYLWQAVISMRWNIERSSFILSSLYLPWCWLCLWECMPAPPMPSSTALSVAQRFGETGNILNALTRLTRGRAHLTVSKLPVMRASAKSPAKSGRPDEGLLRRYRKQRMNEDQQLSFTDNTHSKIAIDSLIPMKGLRQASILITLWHLSSYSGDLSKVNMLFIDATIFRRESQLLLNWWIRCYWTGFSKQTGKNQRKPLNKSKEHYYTRDQMHFDN